MPPIDSRISRRSACLLLCGMIALAGGCKRPEFGTKLDARQSAEVSALADEQIQSQYSGAPENSPGYFETARAFAVLDKHATGLPSGAVLRLSILDTPEQFSMSLPDGHLYLSTGLVRFVAGKPGEAAALVAHQIGHIASNHDAVNLAGALGQDELVGMLDQGKYQDVVNTELELQRLSYTNEQEYEADRYAVRLLAVSGYDASELSRLVTFFAGQSTAPDVRDWTDSHPISKSRVSRINEAVAALH